MLFKDRIAKAYHCSKYALYLQHSNPMYFSVLKKEEKDSSNPLFDFSVQVCLVKMSPMCRTVVAPEQSWQDV